MHSSGAEQLAPRSFLPHEFIAQLFGVRHCALVLQALAGQGIAFKILMVIVDIALGDTLGFAAFWGLLLVRIFVALVLLIFLILAAIKAYQGQYYKLPIIGNIAWNIVNK